ncbi:MAG: hypothetical protein AAF420_12525, partial [Pseudomonadota bacterium]
MGPGEYPHSHKSGRECESLAALCWGFDTDSPIVAGSWHAIRTSADIALTGAQLIIDGDTRAFSACRPPGHHATENYSGGYCYLNNTALAAQSLRDAGMRRVV